MPSSIEFAEIPIVGKMWRPLSAILLTAMPQIPEYSPGTPVANPEAQINVGRFETLKAGGFTMERVLGEREPDNNTNLLIIPQKSTSFDNALSTVHIILKRSLSVKPLDSVKLTVWVLDPATTPDLACINASCNEEAVINLINKINGLNSSTGFLFQETLVWVNEGGSIDRSRMDAQFPGNVPTVRSFGILWWPENRNHSALSYLGPHTFGHFVFDQTDEYLTPFGFTDGNNIFNCRPDTSIWRGLPGDPGTKYEGCGNQPKGYFRTADNDIMASGLEFGPLLTWWVENYSKLMPGNYGLPEFGVSLYRTNPVPGKGFPQGSLDSGIKINLPYGTRQLAIERIPSPDRETGLINSAKAEVYIGDIEEMGRIRNEGFVIRAPIIGVGGYDTLPGMTYTWRVRISNRPEKLEFNDPRWDTLPVSPIKEIPNPAKEGSELISPRGSEKISFPLDGKTTNNLAPSLQWQNGDTDVFYYHLQVSADPNFEKDPAKATAAVWENLIHGGESNPLNSWKVPAGLLQPDKTYYMRIKPRVQGDGTSPEWSTIGSFKTSADAKVLSQKELEVIRNTNGEVIDWQAMQADHWQGVQKVVQQQVAVENTAFIEQFSDPFYGIKPDTDLGRGAYSASAADMGEYGHVTRAAILNDKGKVIGWQVYRKPEDLFDAA